MSNVSYAPNSYEYEDDDYSDDSYSTSYNSNYGRSYNTGSDDGYSNSYDSSYANRSAYSQRLNNQFGDVNTYGRGDRQQHSYYPDSEDPTYSSNGNSSSVYKSFSKTEAKYRVSEVLVIEPTSFEEIIHIVQALRDNKSVVLNLAALDLEYTQRAIDFITGSTYAMDGNYERIGEGIFLFTPSCVQVSNQSNPTQ